jgi:hypothetical protein
MPMSITVSATSFQRGFSKYKDEAIYSDIIEVTNHDRVIGAYISARELENYKKLKAKESQVLILGAISDDIISEISNAQYGAEV